MYFACNSALYRKGDEKQYRAHFWLIPEISFNFLFFKYKRKGEYCNANIAFCMFP